MILPPGRRGDLTNQQWERLKPLLPAQKPKVGRPSNDHRTILNGIRVDSANRCAVARFAGTLWHLGNGVRSILSLFAKVGCGQGCYRGSNQLADADGNLDWEVHYVDGSEIPCSPTCGRGTHGELDASSKLSAIEQVQQREALGRSVGGFSTKIHLRCEGNGLPLTFLLTVGERHEAVVFESLMQQGSVKRSGSGRPRLRPRRVVGDKGYSRGKIRCYLRRRGIRLTIPRKSNEQRRGKA